MAQVSRTQLTNQFVGIVQQSSQINFINTSSVIQANINTSTIAVPNPGSAFHSNMVVFDNSSVPQQADMIRDYLERFGLLLGENCRLKIIDGIPMIIHKHEEGRPRLEEVTQHHHGTLDFSREDHSLLAGTVLKLPDGSYLEIDKDGTLVQESYAHARPRVIDVHGGNQTLYESLAFCNFREIKLSDGIGTNATFILPNGVKLKLFADDHVEIDESDGSQLYRSEPVRDFNKYLNASDLLERFIDYCGKEKITKQEFSELPINLFIYWLLVEAALSDGDPTDEVVPLLTSAVKARRDHTHRCKCCGRFLKASLQTHGIHFCSSQHMDIYLNRL